MNQQRLHFILFSSLALCGCCLTSASAEVLSWKFEASIVLLDDPRMEMDDVRLGDTVRGTFGYDLTTEPVPPDDPEYADYRHRPMFAGIVLEIENPRTGDDQLFVHDPSETYAVKVFTNSGPFDSSEILLGEYAQPPEGFFPWVTMQFAALDLLADVSLPTEYDLDDWPLAVLYLITDTFAGGLDAQIYSLEPVLGGDYDQSGEVNAGDYSAWRDAYGQAGYLAEDGNRDGSVSAADYVVWRNNLGATLGEAAVGSSIPEPGSLVLLLVLLTCDMSRLGRQSRLSGASSFVLLFSYNYSKRPTISSAS